MFEKVKEVDGRVHSYRVFDVGEMKILAFYNGLHNSLYAFDLHKVTLGDALVFIKQHVKENGQPQS